MLTATESGANPAIGNVFGTLTQFPCSAEQPSVSFQKERADATKVGAIYLLCYQHRNLLEVFSLLSTSNCYYSNGFRAR